MAEQLLPVLAVVLPVFLCAAVGWAWTRSGQPYDRTVIMSLITVIGAPCLVFHSLVTIEVPVRELLVMAGATALAIAVFAVLGWVVLRALGLPSHTYLSPIMFGNAGNMGLAVCSLAFPGTAGGVSPGLTFGIAYFAVSSLIQFTIGIVIWSGKLSLGTVVRSPLAWSVAAASLVLGSGLQPPQALLNTTQILGGFAVPMMLITLGSSLGQIDPTRLPQAIVFSVLRLAGGALVGVLLARALGLEGAARVALIVQCFMPPAVFNYLLAEHYQRSPAEVASLVVVGTLLSFAALPLLLVLVL